MTRTPLQQRIVRNTQIIRTSAVRAFYAMYVMIRWWMLYDFTMNRLEKATILREIYLMSYHNGRDSIHDMVYKSDKTSVVNIRMNRNAFKILCDMLEQRGGLKNSKKHVIAMFLHVLAHNEKNRIIVERFKRSGETVSRYFKMRYVDYIKSSTRNMCQYPMTKPMRGGGGALDGTYIKVKVPASKRKPYRTRKGEICTNVLGVRPHGLKIPHGMIYIKHKATQYYQYSLTKYVESIVGTYYLCDAGYTNGEGFLTPYRGKRYHLNDWSRPPTNAKKLYNMRHSLARNVIERCFGLIKSRWAILRYNAYHPIESMPRIIIACCLMHKFIRTTMTEDPLDQEIPTNHTQFGDEHDNVISTVETSQGWTDHRDLLANTMFTDWSSRSANN
uniref:DDE Tnp4 domain-containing protein n=1 Tax=Lactuca sativa TaxID=4236 RepID=A0A9R1UQQ7_LACSA|nr:hypothetical protein LSAT_V11C800427090 [Lactuca sativa]